MADMLRLINQPAKLFRQDIDNFAFDARAKTNSRHAMRDSEVVIQSGQTASRLSVEPKPL